MDEYRTNQYSVAKPRVDAQNTGVLRSMEFNRNTGVLTITPNCGKALSAVIGKSGASINPNDSDSYTVSGVYNQDSGIAVFTNANQTSYELDLSSLKSSGGKYFPGAGITLSSTNTFSLDTTSNPANYVKTITVNGGNPQSANNGNINLNITGTGSNTGTQQDPITIVSSVAEIDNLQAQDSSGSQLMQYVGVTGTLTTSFGTIYLVQGNTYSISDTNKISDLSTEIVSAAAFPGDFNGTDSEVVPVRTRNQNGIKVYQFGFHKTAGTVVSGNNLTLKVNNVVVATLPLSASAVYSKMYANITMNEGDVYTIGAPNNTGLGGIVYLYNVENSIN